MRLSPTNGLLAVGLVFSFAGVSHGAPGAAYPADPFADDYSVPVAEEVGTAAGQLRFLAGLGYGSDSGLSLQSTYEHMTFSYLGLRVSGASSVNRASGEPGFWSFKTGPTVHILPYKVFDISVFVVGGASRVSLDDGATWMPEVSPGLSLDVHPHSYWMLRLEGQYVWGIFRDDGGASSRKEWCGFVSTGFLM